MSPKSRFSLLALLLLAFTSLACGVSGTGSQQDQEALRELISELTQSAPTLTPKAPLTVRVAPDGTGDYLTLAAAVADLAPGSTITLDAGNYTLPDTLRINKSITLQGAGMDQTTLTSTATDGVLVFSGPGNLVLRGIFFSYLGSEGTYVAQITDAGFEISDCRFAGAVRDMEAEIGGHGLYINGASNGSVKGSHFERNQRHGLVIGGQVNTMVDNCTFENNNSNGLGFWDQSVGTVRNCTARNNGNTGFIATGQTEVTFLDNLAENHPDGAGFSAYESANITARRNESTGAGFQAFSLHDQSRGLFEGNLAHHNTQSGFTSFGQSIMTAQNNESYENGNHGFSVQDNSTGTLTNNFSHDNGASGFFVEDDGVLTANNNKANGNDRCGFSISDRGTGNIQNNNIHNNEQSAIAFFDQALGNVSGNQCSGNANGGIKRYDDAGPTIGENNCQP